MSDDDGQLETSGEFDVTKIANLIQSLHLYGLFDMRVWMNLGELDAFGRTKRIGFHKGCYLLGLSGRV